MTTRTPEPEFTLYGIDFTMYGPGRFPEGQPFGRHGYLFAVLGSFPADTPAHTNVTDWLVAVYRTDDGWEARDVNGRRRVWATGESRRATVGMAFQEIARKRRKRATEIRRKRVGVLGLEPDPPYMVEVTGSTTLVLAPARIGVLKSIEPTGEGEPAVYHVLGPQDGQPYEVREDRTVTLRTTQVGVFHDRCGCDPEDAARYDHEHEALVYARHALTECWPCQAQHPDDCVHCTDKDGRPHRPCMYRKPCATCLLDGIEPVG
ncbi:hypothetical protein [Streptomyces carpinensis]|uniref:Uncharacterized protein n=1 Tax=Streptomyces carpinensis TaxID=66369 RepID=A0ABV1VYW4_9ACTN|nr:hypothetical protein [Streptomyces carpinensis]